MYSIRTAILILGLAGAGGAAAQQMYKTVGADGKVTFSDRPALETAAQLSVMRSNTLRPVKVASQEAAPAVAAARSGGQRPAAPAMVEVSPQVEGAMVSVMAQAEFGRRFYRFCNDTPEQGRAFTKAATGWKERNTAAVEQQRKLLMQVVTPAQRTEIHDKVNALLADEQAKVSGKAAPERAQWCSGAIAEMSNDAADVNQPEMMALDLKLVSK